MSDSSKSQAFPEKRSASRTTKPILIVLRCADKSGKSFIEKTRTVDISRTGAKALTEHEVCYGARLQIAIPHRKRMSWATIARIGNRTGDLQEIGIVLDDAQDFWGVRVPEEPKSPGSSEALPQQGRAGTDGSTASRQTNPSLTLAQELLDSARHSSSGAPDEETFDQQEELLQNKMRGELERNLEAALQRLNEQAAAIMKNLQEVVAHQTEEHLRRYVEEAVRQVETAALDVTKRNQPIWEEKIQRLTDRAQEQLRVRLAEHEASLATSAAKERRDLARKLANLSSAVAED